MIKNTLDEVTGLINSPFIGGVSVKQIALATGVVLVAAMLWIFILGYMKAASETSVEAI